MNLSRIQSPTGESHKPPRLGYDALSRYGRVMPLNPIRNWFGKTHIQLRHTILMTYLIAKLGLHRQCWVHHRKGAPLPPRTLAPWPKKPGATGRWNWSKTAREAAWPSDPNRIGWSWSDSCENSSPFNPFYIGIGPLWFCIRLVHWHFQVARPGPQSCGPHPVCQTNGHGMPQNWLKHD